MSATLPLLGLYLATQLPGVRLYVQRIVRIDARRHAAPRDSYMVEVVAPEHAHDPAAPARFLSAEEWLALESRLGLEQCPDTP